MQMAHPPLPDTSYCIVCGYPEFASFKDGLTTFEICPCCGCQSGYSYSAPDQHAHLNKLRTDWLYDVAGNWWSPVDARPKGWSARDQLKAANLPIPTPRNPQREQANL